LFGAVFGWWRSNRRGRTTKRFRSKQTEPDPIGALYHVWKQTISNTRVCIIGYILAQEKWGVNNRHCSEFAEASKRDATGDPMEMSCRDDGLDVYAEAGAETSLADEGKKNSGRFIVSSID
jgi:hypothetical protein